MFETITKIDVLSLFFKRFLKKYLFAILVLVSTSTSGTLDF